jgi:hypothetical protein
MIKLLTRPVVWPVKASAYSLVAGYKTGRLVGYRRLTVFGLGVAVGLMVAPVPGRELRDRLMDRLGLAKPIALPAATRAPAGPVPGNPEAGSAAVAGAAPIDLTD